MKQSVSVTWITSNPLRTRACSMLSGRTMLTSTRPMRTRLPNSHPAVASALSFGDVYTVM